MKETSSQYSIKFRPHKWEDVYGQDTVVKSLKKRVIDNNFPKAVLFEGPFGTGKTTIAEILAAAMQASLPDGNPDWNHSSCKTILNETFDRDTQRLDGSQIGGKMDIVEFTSSLRVRPMYDKKRIFIIEEADQLSKAAMNALLKVLEDPQPNVHFILLSMLDKQGVSPAIRSRCQVYKIKPLSVKDMMFAMKHVMEETGDWTNEDIPDEFKLEGLKAIAIQADGSLRAALQTLESCIIGKIFSVKEIEENFATVDEYTTWKVLESLLDKSKDESLWYKIFDSDAMQLYNYMTMLLAEAILCKETGFVYAEKDGWSLKKLASHPNTEALYYSLILHPQMNKPFMRTTDLVGALVGYYQGFDFRAQSKKTLPGNVVPSNWNGNVSTMLLNNKIPDKDTGRLREDTSNEKIVIGTREAPPCIQVRKSVQNPSIPVRTPKNVPF